LSLPTAEFRSGLSRSLQSSWIGAERVGRPKLAPPVVAARNQNPCSRPPSSAGPPGETRQGARPEPGSIRPGGRRGKKSERVSFRSAATVRRASTLRIAINGGCPFRRSFPVLHVALPLSDTYRRQGPPRRAAPTARAHRLGPPGPCRREAVPQTIAPRAIALVCGRLLRFSA